MQQCISPWGDSMPCCSSHSRVCRTSERTHQKPQIQYSNTKILTEKILKILKTWRKSSGMTWWRYRSDMQWAREAYFIITSIENNYPAKVNSRKKIRIGYTQRRNNNTQQIHLIFAFPNTDICRNSKEVKGAMVKVNKEEYMNHLFIWLWSIL